MAAECTATAAISAELVPADKIEEDAPAPSTSADKVESLDVDSEAKKLLGLGQKHLVMGDIPAAVNAFQEAASLLGKKYGETANECGEAFYFYGKSLLELARMENGVLGNALEGVHVEGEEEEKADDESLVENNDNTDEEAREELREQVYDAMGESEAKRSEDKSLVKPDTEQETEMEKSADLSEPVEELQEKVESTPDQLPEITAEAKGTLAPELKEPEKPEQQAVDAEEGKSVSGTDTKDKECRGKGQEEQGEEIVAMEEKPKELSEEQSIMTLKEPGTSVKVEAESGDLTVKPVDLGGKEPKEQMAASENEPGKAVLEEQLVVQEMPLAEESPKMRAVPGSEASEKVEEETKVLPKDDVVSGLSAVGDQTLTGPQMSAEGEKKDGSGIEEKVRAELIPSQVETKLSIEDETTGDGIETKVAQGATEKSSEDKDKIAANEETQGREDQMKEGEETEGSEEEDKEENDKAEDMPNDSVLENKSLQENEEEEIGNLELAWDMLDLAKIIFKRQETKEAQLYAAQAHLKLGEVSVESENYLQAVEEFQACLTLQEQYLEPYDRLLAETHYQLGLAFGYNSQYDEAVAQFSKSIDVIEKRMAVLNEQKDAKGSPAEYEKEIEELKELLPEIREKIEDAKESQRSGNVAELALKATLVESSTSGFTSSGGGSSVSMIASRKPTDGGATSSNCVTDISHLVRKKRKPEEDSPRKDDAKKAKQEPEVNGGSEDAVPGGNDVSENMEETENKAESRAAVEGTVEAGATVESTAC
ncbi:nuclear autoantigenic sperm protein [Rhynchocyon petersi]